MSSTKSIFQLVPDIYQLVKQRPAFKLETSFEAAGERRAALRLSAMGKQCPCALWHSINKPELAEPIPSWVMVKFMYGHMVESLAISLARLAGHEVTGEQDELSLDGILGHRDCVIDGCLVDVKSTNKYGIAAFKEKRVDSDIFLSSYLDQLDGYLVGSSADPLVTCKDRGYILAIDKQLGHMELYEHVLREESIRERIRKYKEIVALPNAPRCTCGQVPEGKSGNIILDTKASYNNFKFCCFPNLRTFLYSTGPKYFSKVVRTPDVTEVDKNGKIVYH